MAEGERSSAGDSNRITREYFDSILLETRYIDSAVPSTALKLFGEEFSTPIMTAALSHLKINPSLAGGASGPANGMAQMARGAFMAGAVSWAGMGDDAELEAILATGARTIKIIKPYADEALILAQIGTAVRGGALAVGMDVDHSFSSDGRYDVVMGSAMQAKSLGQLKEYVRAAGIPFIVKGVLSVRDAQKCLEAGAGGIVVSHHHGIMDYSVPPLMALPGIVKAIGGAVPVFVDCGVCSGMDAFKALALGADAVSVGRALMGPLKERGAEGVRDRIGSLTAELAGAMARTGARDLSGIDGGALRFGNFAPGGRA